jgi:hypothetical protein
MPKVIEKQIINSNKCHLMINQEEEYFKIIIITAK